MILFWIWTSLALVYSSEKDEKNGKVDRNGKCNLFLECPPFNRITLGQHRSYNIKCIIQLTDVGIMGSAVSVYNKRLILLAVILLSGE